MAWIVKDDEERKFFDELTKLPDRVVGILAMTIVDDRLTDAIKAHWHDIKTKDGPLLTRLLTYDGPVGSFGARVDIGFAMGLYWESTYHDLHIIRRVRNKFAHYLAPNDFAHNHISDLTRNLQVPDRYPIMPEGTPLTTGMNPSKYQFAETMLGHSSVSDITDSRSRFIRAAEILSVMLSIETMGADQERKAPQF